MTEENNNDPIEYDSSGWDALDTVRKGGSLPWLDFQQGRGDTAVVRLLEIKGTRQKSYRGGDPYQVLEMRVEVHERNGETIKPEIHMTNPKSSWCIDIKRAVNEIAKKEGWDGSPETLGKYAEHVPFYLMRWTRNDDGVTRMGNIDVDLQDRIDSPLDVPFHEEEDHTDFFNALKTANNLEELDTTIKLGWKALPQAERIKAKKAYETKKAELEAIDLGDIPW